MEPTAGCQTRDATTDAAHEVPERFVLGAIPPVRYPPPIMFIQGAESDLWVQTDKMVTVL